MANYESSKKNRWYVCLSFEEAYFVRTLIGENLFEKGKGYPKKIDPSIRKFVITSEQMPSFKRVE